MLILQVVAVLGALRAMYELGEHVGNKNGMKNQVKIMRKLFKP